MLCWPLRARLGANLVRPKGSPPGRAAQGAAQPLQSRPEAVKKESFAHGRTPGLGNLPRLPRNEVRVSCAPSRQNRASHRSALPARCEKASLSGVRRAARERNMRECARLGPRAASTAPVVLRCVATASKALEQAHARGSALGGVECRRAQS